MRAADVLIVVAVLVALVVGVGINRFGGRSRGDASRTSLSDIVTQALTLAILFVAFVLVENSQTFASARSAADGEADTVDHMFELADYSTEPVRQELQGTLVCYVRSIRHHEWRQAASGSFAPEVSVWANGLRRPIGEVLDQDGTLFELLVSADKERANQHQTRILAATGVTPGSVYVLVLVTLVVSIFGFALLLPRDKHWIHAVTLATLSVVLIAAILLIRDLERPFTGVTKVAPRAFTLIQRELDTEYSEHYGADTLPCDESGLEASGRVRT